MDLSHIENFVAGGISGALRNPLSPEAKKHA